jgi:riboflavin synthase
MFTGLIADVGRVTEVSPSADGYRFTIETGLADRISTGDSVAVNGACLTATEVEGSRFSVDAMNQTISLTSLSELEDGAPVNLELALEAGERLGGHLVQGHVDGVGEVLSATDDGFSVRLRFSLPSGFGRYVIPQGSITVEGVSLTVTECTGEWAEVALIPETRERTTLGRLGPGRRLNLECDVIARYVERMVSPYVEEVQDHDLNDES